MTIPDPNHASATGTARKGANVLMVTSTFPARPDDGKPSFVLDLAQALTSDHRVRVLAPRSFNASAEWADIEVVRFSYFWKRWERLADDAIVPALRASPWPWLQVPPFLIAMASKTTAEVRRLECPVVNAHWIIPGGLAAWVASRIHGAPYVVTVHGADIHTFQSGPLKALKRLVLSGAQRVMPVSASVRSALIELEPRLDETITEALPMGVVPAGRPNQAERSTTEFVFVGRLARKKGLTVALEAVARVEGARLRVVGDGPDMKHAWNLASDLNLESRVRFQGRLGRQRVFSELSRSAGLLVPSIVAPDGDQEGTPVVLAEAFATATPTIASTVGGLREHLTHGVNGVLVPPGDVDALARSIAKAIEDPDAFRSLGDAGHSGFEGGPLDMRETAKRYSAVIDAVLAET